MANINDFNPMLVSTHGVRTLGVELYNQKKQSEINRIVLLDETLREIGKDVTTILLFANVVNLST